MEHDSVDVAIVGAGLAGASLAAVLSRAGIRVAMIDPHASAPADFRAEKLSSGQVAALRRLDLADAVLARTTPIDRLAIARFGRIVEARPNCEYGIDYPVLVDAVRDQAPRETLVVGRAASLATSADRQVVTLSDGRRIEVRLLVIATGLGRTLTKSLGLSHVSHGDDGCLAIGFDLAGPWPLPAPALTLFGAQVGSRAAYLTLFPIQDRIRANLFVYRRHDEDWATAFRADPSGRLLAIMPELATLVGDVRVSGPVVMRPIKLYAVDDPVRDGVVLIGDAFATTCPTGGTGIGKVLTDVERLAAYVPQWLATPGLGAEKVRQFYEDPAKRACDADARRATAYARAMAVDAGAVWTARRYRNFYAQRMRHWARGQLSTSALRRPAAAAALVACCVLGPTALGPGLRTDATARHSALRVPVQPLVTHRPTIPN